MQSAWGLSSVLFGRCAFSPHAMSGLSGQREDEKLMTCPQPLAQKCRDTRHFAV